MPGLEEVLDPPLHLHVYFLKAKWNLRHLLFSFSCKMSRIIFNFTTGLFLQKRSKHFYRYISGNNCKLQILSEIERTYKDDIQFYGSNRIDTSIYSKVFILTIKIRYVHRNLTQNGKIAIRINLRILRRKCRSEGGVAFSNLNYFQRYHSWYLI